MVNDKAIVLIRDAIREDVQRITDIYNHAVLYSKATADWDPVTVGQRLSWFDERKSAAYPVIVATNDSDEVLGWASLNPYSHKAGYQFTAENSVYIAPEAQGQGVGTLLLGELVIRAREKGLRSIVASIDAANGASVRIHQKFGFKEVALYKELAFKFDSWMDVVHMQLML